MKSQATEKIQTGLKTFKGNKYGEVMKNYVAETLTAFCSQNEEFARAVVDGGTFTECMEAICKGIGSSISDLDVAKRAAAFYFPGCEIQMQMTIYTSAFERDEAKDAEMLDDGIVLNLEDFL